MSGLRNRDEPSCSTDYRECRHNSPIAHWHAGIRFETLERAKPILLLSGQSWCIDQSCLSPWVCRNKAALQGRAAIEGINRRAGAQAVDSYSCRRKFLQAQVLAGPGFAELDGPVELHNDDEPAHHP